MKEENINVQDSVKKLQDYKDAVFLEYVKDLQKTVMELNSKNNKLVEEFKELGKEYDKVVNDLNNSESRVSQLGKMIKTQDEVFQALNSDFEDLQEENKEIKNKNITCEEILKIKEDEINRLTLKYQKHFNIFDQDFKRVKSEITRLRGFIIDCKKCIREKGKKADAIIISELKKFQINEKE